jgi:hypothetical protein
MLNQVAYTVTPVLEKVNPIPSVTPVLERVNPIPYHLVYIR